MSGIIVAMQFGARIRLRLRSIGLVCAIIFTLCAGRQRLHAAPTDSGEFDLPSPASLRLAEGLARDGMPELVESLIRGQSPINRTLLARAYAAAARNALDAGRNEQDLAAAQAAYRDALGAAEDAGWNNDPRRRFIETRWRVELADFILRECCATDLDDQEINSGLIPPSARLRTALASAVSDYRLADRALTDIRTAMARDEDRIAAQGLAESAPALSRACSLNLAWSLTYHAATLRPTDRTRVGELSEALQRFDGTAHDARTADERLNAMIGAAIAFRESDRLDDAWKLLKGVVQAGGPTRIELRARYELARTALKRDDFENAARTFAELAQARTDSTAASRDGSSAGDGGFYVRLAPVLHAYTLIRQARLGGARSEELRQRAADELAAIAARGGPWPAITELYYAENVPMDAEPAGLRPPERRILARRLMARGRFEPAARAWQAYLDRSANPTPPPDFDEARIDLATCLSRTKRERDAVQLLCDVAEQSRNRAVGRRAAQAAIETISDLARSSGLDADQERLSEICRRLGTQLASTREGDGLLIAAAGSLERGGRSSQAAELYGKVPPSSARYWSARVAALRCRQAALSTGATRNKTADAQTGESLVHDWDQLAEEMRQAATQHPLLRTVLLDLCGEAAIHTAELLAGNRLNRPTEALDRLDSAGISNASGEMAPVLAIRIRCYRRLNDTAKLEAAIAEFLRRSGSAEAGPLLVEVAAELEQQIDRDVAADQFADAGKLANQALPILQRLEDWFRAQSGRQNDAALVRLSIGRMLVCAGRAQEALPIFAAHLKRHSDDGEARRWQALGLESLAQQPNATPASASAAENAWGGMLVDQGLRDAAPARYWEARYYWLAWQLRRGRSADVVKGIEAERVWYPELGGPRWKDKLLKLADDARRTTSGSNRGN